MKIQVLGAGCSKCSRAAQVMKESALGMGLLEGKDFDFEKVTDIQEMIKYKVMLTPGIVINEKVVLTGKVPSNAEAQQLLTTAMSEENK